MDIKESMEKTSKDVGAKRCRDGVSGRQSTDLCQKRTPALACRMGRLCFQTGALRCGKTDTRPDAESMQLFVTVSGLTPGVSYKLYRYSSVESVPNNNINANASKAARAGPFELNQGPRGS
jgi:hypothetical protein